MSNMIRFTLSFMMIVALAIPAWSQDEKKDNPTKEDSEKDLRMVSTRSSPNSNFKINIDEAKLAETIERAVNQAMRSVDSAIESIEIEIEDIEIDLRDLDLSIDPIQIYIPEFDVNVDIDLNDDDSDWDDGDSDWDDDEDNEKEYSGLKKIDTTSPDKDKEKEKNKSDKKKGLKKVGPN